MKSFLFTLSLLMALNALGQSSSILTMDFVKVKNGKHQEALYFYENNWKLYRDIALQRGFIQSYRLVTTTADSLADFDIILITEYADSTHLQASEQPFQQIIKEVRTNVPRLLNEWKPADFRQKLYLRRAKTVFSSAKNIN